MRGLPAVLALAACAGEPASTEERAVAPELAPAALVRVAATPGLASLDRDVAVVCADRVIASDAIGAAACDVAIVEPDGALRRLGRDDVEAAVRVDAGRLAIVGADHRLIVITDDGSGERELAVRAADVRAAGPGRVVFTEL